LKLATQKVNHIDKIIEIAITSGMPLGELNLVVDTFENTVGQA
jgi:hypothetical protein